MQHLDQHRKHDLYIAMKASAALLEPHLARQRLLFRSWTTSAGSRQKAGCMMCYSGTGAVCFCVIESFL